MSKFKKGDKVYIADGSDYYSQGIRKGVKMLGVVVDPCYSDGWLQVQWENGDANSYQNEDLIHASEPTIKMTITEQCGFEVGETVECCDHGMGMGQDQLGKLFTIAEFGSYGGDLGVRLKYKSNGKIYSNPMFKDFVDIRSICKPKQSTSEPEKEVSFTIGDRTVNYKLSGTFYTAKGANSEIFTLLGMNQSQKQKFCSEAYGYEAGSGDWPTWKYDDNEAPIKIIKAIREAIAKLGITKTDITAAEPDFDAILAEARRSYPVGTRYRPLSSTGTERGGTETSLRDCRWINGHEGGKMGIDCGIGYVYILKTDTWAEVIDQPVATKEPKEPELLDLLAEARRRYPVGTRYRPLSSTGTNWEGIHPANFECKWYRRKSEGDPYDGIECGEGLVYWNGKWAALEEETNRVDLEYDLECAAILAEAQRRYPVGTYYNPLDEHGNAYAVEPRRAVRECEWVTTGHGIDCGMGYVYVCGKWADIPGIISAGTVSAGTGTVSVGTTNTDLRVSSITGTYSNPYGTAPGEPIYNSTTPQYITVSGTIDLNSMARKTLPDMQDPIIVKRNKQRTKLTVL